MGLVMNILFEKYINEISFQKIMRSQNLNEKTQEIKSINKYISDYINPYLK
jgi:hypothetical protein